MKTKNNKLSLDNIKKAFKYTKRARKYCALYLLVAILDGINGILLPVFSAKVILGITDKIINQVILSASIVFLIELFNSILLYLKVLASRKIQQAASSDLQYDLIKETMKIETSEIDKKTSGLFVDRLNKDAQELSTMFMEFSYCITKIISNIGVLVAILLLNKYLFIYSIIISIIIFLISKIRVNKGSTFKKELRKINEEKTGLISEIIRGIRDIKVLNATDNVATQTRKKIKEACEEEVKLSTVEMLYTTYEKSANALGEFIFILLGIYLYQKGLLTIPAFIIAYNYQPRVRNLLTAVSLLLDNIKQFQISSERVFEILENKTFKKEKFGHIEIKDINGNIEFKNVSFAYNNSKKTIDNISFKINANKKVAFVGKSGAGKSTIFNLIAKLYNVNSGKILIDNIDINELSCSSLRDNISIINQNPYIFNFSIKDNLLLVKNDATMEEIREACKLACIDDYIMNLPEKYNTIIGENGVTLSGGERQRISIARALLMKTKIILFDEATSALDNETQNNINKAIKNLKGDYTILIIAHRLSTVVDCDKIFVVDDGKIIDVGTHEELLKKSKFYKKLYNEEK